MKGKTDTMNSISDDAMKLVKEMQTNELTEYYIYNNIADKVKNEDNKKILRNIAQEELAHGKLWESYSRTEVKPKKLKIFWYTLLARVCGYTFAIKLMEKGEDNASEVYEKLSEEIDEASRIAREEQEHEKKLIDMLDEERLQYVGSMVLGLNDALVELTGTLAGLTFALQSTRLIALSGLITGISATLSMASSEYLAAKSDGRSDALKSCAYTGVAYCITVALLVLPYLLFPDDMYAWALGVMVCIVILIIFIFSYYISVAKDLSFKSRFGEMAAISIGVAIISFIIGLVVKKFLGIDV